MDREQKERKQNRKAQAKKDRKTEKKRSKISSGEASEREAGSKAKVKGGAGANAKGKSKKNAAKSKKLKDDAKVRSKRQMMALGPAVSPQNRRRLAAGFAFLLLVFAGLLFRMGYWQIYKADELKLMAVDMQKADTEIEPARGSIYDSQMNTLAESIREYELYAYSQSIYKANNIGPDAKAENVKKLAAITGKKEEELTAALTGDENLVLLADGLKREQVEEAEKEFSDNVVVRTKVSRYYPNGAFAAQVLGGVNSENIGRAGIEYQYNSKLAGIKGRTMMTIDSNGNTLSNGNGKYYKAQDGYSVVTTIDSVIQHFVEDALEDGMEDTGAEAITCIVMDPKSGDILAMATTPEYDPNNSAEPSGAAEKARFDKMSHEEQTEYLSRMWRNNAVSDIYEPGSTFKLITAAAALESDSADDKTTYTCKGSTRVADQTLRCLYVHGKQTLIEAVGNSCNPALATAALDMGSTTFYNYIDLLGFNDQTGVDLPGEGYPLVKDPVDLSKVDLATTGYGQGIAVTPLQILCAVNSFGNGGVLMKPKIVDKIIDKDGKVVEQMKDVKVRQAVSEETADKMCEIMEYYVAKAGGKTAYVPGYRVGGKTGTANRVSGSRYSEATNTSFVVMAPMDDPQISMICIVYRPTKKEYGAFTAGPIVKDITEKTLQYLGVERNYTKSEEKAEKKNLVKVPDVTGMDSSRAIALLQNEGFKYEVMPESASEQSFVVIDQYPKAGAKVEKKSTVYLYSE